MKREEGVHGKRQGIEWWMQLSLMAWRGNRGRRRPSKVEVFGIVGCVIKGD